MRAVTLILSGVRAFPQPSHNNSLYDRCNLRVHLISRAEPTKGTPLNVRNRPPNTHTVTHRHARTHIHTCLCLKKPSISHMPGQSMSNEQYSLCISIKDPLPPFPGAVSPARCLKNRGQRIHGRARRKTGSLMLERTARPPSQMIKHGRRGTPWHSGTAKDTKSY